MTKLEGMLRAFERRNFAGKNGIFTVRFHQLDRPIFLERCTPHTQTATSKSPEHYNYREDYSKYPNHYNHRED
ncbi:hypothetical protein NEUTE1DRAFT_41805 [Neurospora tetrasperma FGSC 2508]|uniref:Uncharacterized protein n=1 Tax=Neurospora tetrasperma (strain FGSC 2508 / ATCC MYA-4615 / P0657) TaxID=510951 RepID=F8MK94_NEUT8|nr:uncharacterized protein NEUTE1DRAFT_41805 [Neurospora tetrasperma FGSC 2508]EGO57378.1 hypothetical protein NEUTE1DRAFT_41805 [Neurospora tetrasperma FGSC 2508]EGZ72367.1 hypothetical protein NEUTE2DRAFT_66386 [Neurospora tetrasperma FGSC 2509]